jgi:hypothetical protein
MMTSVYYEFKERELSQRALPKIDLRKSSKVNLKTSENHGKSVAVKENTHYPQKIRKIQIRKIRKTRQMKKNQCLLQKI